MKIIRIGRLHTNDCVIDNPNVSRNHAELHLDSDGQHGTLYDLGSTYGTFVNNPSARITSPTRVSRGDTIYFSSVVMTFDEIIARAQRGAHQAAAHQPVSRPVMPAYDDSIEVEVDNDPAPAPWNRSRRSTSSSSKGGGRTTIIAIVAVVLCLLLGGGGYAAYTHFSKWDKTKVYSEYNSAVCWVTIGYGYKIYVDNQDVTKDICDYCSVPYDELVYLDDSGSLCSGMSMAQGTAFFISNDGKLATNLHITRPWLVSQEKEQLEDGVNEIIKKLARRNSALLRSKIDIKHVVKGIYVVPNGLPICEANAIQCDEISNNDDINKDVSIIQTQTRKLPADVKRIIDINEADLSDEAIAVGTYVYTIGFPYGAEIALDSRQNLRNQIHSGSVTQDRGEYEYGHDAETVSGASGSPIINERGRLVGVHHAGLTGVTGAQGFNRAIKVKYLLDLMK